MKKIMQMTIIIGVIILGFAGSNRVNKDYLRDTYKKIDNYFAQENKDDSNIAEWSIDRKNNVVIVTLVDNSKDSQEVFLKQTKVNPKYIKFEQGDKYRLYTM